jgi:arsenical pump membrane protein
MALTVGLALVRPAIAVRGASVRLGPATAGLVGLGIVLAARVAGLDELRAAAATLWQPLVTVASIMLLAAAARENGLLDGIASRLEASRLGTRGLFVAVFATTAAATVLLNNDAAVLVLTPLVVSLVRRRHPSEPRLIPPFAFAVLFASGVAPLVVSNPMNMIVAHAAGIDFNGYARVMVPIWLAGTALTLALLYLVFRRDLANVNANVSVNVNVNANVNGRSRAIAVVLVAVLAAYPLVTVAGGPLWAVALAGAALATLLSPRRRWNALLSRGVSWNILVFLYAVFVLAMALGKLGVVALLMRLYAHGSPALVGVTSAIGSAALNNHPMAILNLFALERLGGSGTRLYAALVGGDLGPRLLPIGSLAGLLWLESLRAQGAAIPIRTFVRVGLAVTLPVLALSLMLLAGHG